MITAAAARHLLSVDAVRHHSYRRQRLYPMAAALLNLFFCASFERYLSNDAGGFYLSLFLLLEATVYSLFTLTHFFSVSFEILSKSRIFPVTPVDRLLFVIVSDLRLPMVIAFVTTTTFFLVILFRDTFWSAFSTVVILALLFVTLEVFLSTVMLTFTRRSLSPAGIVVMLLFVLFSALTGSLVFRYETLISSIPFIRWTADGMIAAAHGEAGGVMSSMAWLASTAGVVLLLGRKLA